MKKLILCLVLLLMGTVSAVAGTVTFVCDFQKYSDHTGVHDVKGDFILTFIVDREKGVAYSLGNQGSAEVMMVPSGKGFTFIEITAVGNVMTTTIDTLGNSVHSRNTVIQGEVVPSQYYGTCKCK